MLSCSVPIYNFLLDKLEDECDKRAKEKGEEDVIVKALKASINKLVQYYTYTSGIIYVVSTGKYNLYFIYIILFIFYIN
jgi:hypothetical protein